MPSAIAAEHRIERLRRKAGKSESLRIPPALIERIGECHASHHGGASTPADPARPPRPVLRQELGEAGQVHDSDPTADGVDFPPDARRAIRGRDER